jgi:Protein of unknown function VcgC/VcgE (DUF2780)
MNHKKILYKCTPFLLSILAGLPGVVNAEDFSLDSVSKGQTTQTVQSGARGVTDANSTAVQGSLTDTLVKKLSISSEQAQGGAGALFQLAKGKLDAGQFAELSKAVPEMDSLLSAAPKPSGALSALAEGASSALGEANNSYGNLAGLASAFKVLNLSPDRVDEFVPVVVDYVRANSGALTANMLQSALYGGL